MRLTNAAPIIGEIVVVAALGLMQYRRTPSWMLLVGLATMAVAGIGLIRRYLPATSGEAGPLITLYSTCAASLIVILIGILRAVPGPIHPPAP